MKLTTDFKAATMAPERRLENARVHAKLVSRAALRAERRRAPAQPHHPVRLAGFHAGANFVGAEDAEPLLVERQDQDFIAGVLADLGTSDTAARARVFDSPPRRDNGRPRLYQPIQRVHTLALFEAFCDVPGTPRLDRAKIQSSGMVLRRIGRGGVKQAWIKGGTQIFGWDSIDEDVDPEADKRTPPDSVGHPLLDSMLPSNVLAMRAQAQRLATVFGPEIVVTESVIPLFAAPPEVCLASGRTLLFGTVPVTSSDKAEAPAESPRYGDDDGEHDDLQKHLVPFLRDTTRYNLGGEHFVLHPSWANRVNDKKAITVTTAPTNVENFLLLLQQLHMEFDAFGDSPASQALFASLNVLKLERTQNDGSFRLEPAGDFLKQAKAILFDNTPNDGLLSMPASRAPMTAAQAAAVFAATLRCLDTRFLALRAAQGRFDDPTAQYVVRAFVRIAPEHAGCPPKFIWSPYSEPFTIAPWFESSGAAPPLIVMPDLFDRDLLKKLKPNVSFALPPKLAKLLQNDAMDLRDGKGDEKEWTIGWICSFSLPIITLCAFIVLSIFLSIFAMIFFWLPFLKICIPYPKKK
jgi:hypothetical protein